MQVASTLWPNKKSQKISERRFRLNSTKCSPRTKPNRLRTVHSLVIGQGEAQTSPPKGSWGRLAPLGGRPTTWSADGLVGPTALARPRGGVSLAPHVGSTRIGGFSHVAPCYKYKGGGREWNTHTPHLTSLT
jgi:hypothetical protein